MQNPEEADRQMSSEKRNPIGVGNTFVMFGRCEEWGIGSRKWSINWKR